LERYSHGTKLLNIFARNLVKIPLRFSAKVANRWSYTSASLLCLRRHVMGWSWLGTRSRREIYRWPLAAEYAWRNTCISPRVFIVFN